MSTNSVTHNFETACLPRPLASYANLHNTILWSAWRHGLDGRDWVHQTPLFVAGVGALSGVTGMAVNFLDTPFKLPVPVAALLIGSVAMILVGLGAQSHVQGQAARHNENLTKTPLKYICSRLASGRIEKASEAYIVGRGIHDVGYALQSRLMHEQIQCAQARGSGMPEPTLKNDDLVKIGEDYITFRLLHRMATSNGLLQPGSPAWYHVKTRHADIIEEQMAGLMEKAGFGDWPAKWQAEADRLHDEINSQRSKTGPSGMYRPPFSRLLERRHYNRAHTAC